MTDVTLQTYPIVVKFAGRARQYADIFVGLENALDTDAAFFLSVVKPNMDGTDVEPNVPSLGVGDDIIDAALVTAGRALLDAKEIRDLAQALGDVRAAILVAKPLLIKATVNPRTFFTAPPA